MRRGADDVDMYKCGSGWELATRTVPRRSTKQGRKVLYREGGGEGTSNGRSMREGMTSDGKRAHR